MTLPSPPPMPQPGENGIADLLLAIGTLMRECHVESLALQDAIAKSIPDKERRLSHLETYQHIDRMTQIHEDLARLFPQIANALTSGHQSVDHLSGGLRLMSLRDRLFSGPTAHDPHQTPGDVSLF